MKAIVLSNDRRPELRDIFHPSPTAGQVVLEVDHCGICGSDLHAATSSIYRTGVVMGHEFSGRIVEAAHDVVGWKVGDYVCINPNGAYCGLCSNCRKGQFNLCPQILTNSIGAAEPGRMAEFAAVDARTLHQLPEGMSGAQGSWVEPTAVAMTAVRRHRIRRRTNWLAGYRRLAQSWGGFNYGCGTERASKGDRNAFVDLSNAARAVKILLRPRSPESESSWKVLLPSRV
ncbi:alcohol dehydrogenase catalytic domain-containing protein [Acidisoma sp. L85]|uniref:alcohol dehydrogenase catalytic domain-containing protein n=1 Tax=Acidisoma sp. L85 TaxID=1641850 RepID=UPI00131E66F4